MRAALAETGLKGAPSCRDLGGRIRARATALGQGSQDPHHLLLSGLAGALDEALGRQLDEGHLGPAVEVLVDLLRHRNRDLQLSVDLDGLSQRLRRMAGPRALQSAS